MQTLVSFALLSSLLWSAACGKSNTVTVPVDFHGTVLISCQGGGTERLEVAVDQFGIANSKTCPNTEIPLRIIQDGKQIRSVNPPKWFWTNSNVVMAISFDVP